MTTATKNMLTLEELMKPSIITCGKCGGELHIIPYKEWLNDKHTKFEIKTINICGKCTFGK